MLWFTISQLQSGSPRARLAAVRKLRGSTSAAASAALVRQLNDRDVKVRAAVADALGEVEVEQSLQPLLKVLGDPADEVKEAAISSLQRLGDRSAVEGLRSVMSKGSHRVRSRAARALTALGWAPKKGEETSMYYLATGRIDMTVTQGAGAIGPLTQLMREGSYEQRVEAVEMLARISDERALDPLLKALKDEDPLVRTAAANALGFRRDPAALMELRQIIRDPNCNVRVAVVEALGDIADPAAGPDVHPALKDPHWEVRAQALRTLGRLGYRDSMDDMVACLKDPDKEVRQAAADALGELGATAGLAPLVLGLIDEDLGVRQSSLRALWRVNPYWERSPLVATVVPELRAALRSGSVSVQHAAAIALRRLDHQARRTGGQGYRAADSRRSEAGTRVFLTLLNDADATVRLAAVECLERCGDGATEQTLQPLCGDPDRWVREAAERAVLALRSRFAEGGEGLASTWTEP